MRDGGLDHALGRLALDGVPVLGSEHGKRPDGLVGEEHRAQREPKGLGAEPGRDLRRADPAVVETSLLGGVTGQSPEVERRTPAHGGVERRHARGDAEEEAGLLVGDDDLAARVQRCERLAGPRTRLGERGGQFAAAVAGALAQDRARAAHRVGQPACCLRGQVVAPRRDVEDRDGVGGHRVADGHAGTDPLVESVAPVLGPADQHRSGSLERGAHPVRPGRPLRPARPRRHVALPRAAQRVRVALDGQDLGCAVGDRDDAPEALDLGRDRRGGAAEVGEHDRVLERVLGRRLVVGGRGRCAVQPRVDVVLLAAAVPGCRHLGPDSPHTVIAGKKAFACRSHRPVPLRVTEPMTLDSLTHQQTGVYGDRRHSRRGFIAPTTA